MKTTVVLNTLITLFAAALYLWAGFEWSQSTWARAGLRFDQGWLLIAVLISQVATIWLAGAKPSKQRWAQIVIYSVGGFTLEAVTDKLAVVLSRQPTRNGLLYFAILAQLFLMYVLSWIVVFPYEEFVGSPPEHRPSWSFVVRLTGVMIAAAVITGAVWSLRMMGPDAANALYDWLFKAALLIYGYLAVRIFYPMVLGRVRAGRLPFRSR